MVEASKLRRAQQRILAFRPYGLRMRQVLADLSGASESVCTSTAKKTPGPDYSSLRDHKRPGPLRGIQYEHLSQSHPGNREM